MGLYDSVKLYADTLNIPTEIAIIRVSHLNDVKKAMKKSRKCPKCKQYTLDAEYGELEAGARDSVFCDNQEGCDFRDTCKNKYLFAFDHDFDELFYMSKNINVRDAEQVYKRLLMTWVEYAIHDTKELVEGDKPLVNKLEEYLIRERSIKNKLLKQYN